MWRRSDQYSCVTKAQQEKLLTRSEVRILRATAVTQIVNGLSKQTTKVSKIRLS